MGYIMDLREKLGSRPIIMTAACVIILDEERRLLLQHRTDNDCWGLPGGAMELGERTEETAKRELLEETGLIADKLELFDVFSGPELYYQYPNGDEVYVVAAAYFCHDYHGIMQPDEDETSELQFFHLNDLPDHIQPPDVTILSALEKKIKAHLI
ncbi:NUDIX hydrolase [Ectobacillus sp. sgz5001026]|uniref:NUDIX hydrolase n=1 Tax=Ectobacillus sp. sgz5001026 TaxID=3242473 RepID=UPI0036D2C5F0